MSRVPRSASAALRSRTPSKRSSSRPLCTRPSATRSGPAAGGSVARTAPGASRNSGSSVRTSTVTSPLMPWARPIRPTTSCTVIALLRGGRGGNGAGPVGSAARPAPRGVPRLSGHSTDVVHVDEIDADVPATEGGDNGAQRARRAPAAADDLPEVLGVHPDLQDAAPAQLPRTHLDVVRVLDDALHQVLEGLLEHAQASVEVSDASAPSASSFLSDFLALGVMATPVVESSKPWTAFAKRCEKSVSLGAAVFSGAGAGSPLYFCQSPVSFRMSRTGSVGCAPTLSQYCARSESTSIFEGLYVGW